MDTTSTDDFEKYWALSVAEVLNLEYDDVYAIYGSDDAYDTNMNTRAMWKFAMAQGVSGTPVAFMNGVKLDNMPTTTTKWMRYLNSVYKS